MNEEEAAGEVAALAEPLIRVGTLLDFLDQEENSKLTHILTLRELRKSINLK